MGGMPKGTLRDTGAESVGHVGERRLWRRRYEEADVTLNSNNPTLTGGEQKLHHL